MTALIITCYNRPQYLLKCLESLEKLTELPDFFIFVDDASTDPIIRNIIGDFIAKNQKFYCTGVFLAKNQGIKNALRVGVEMAMHGDCDLFINLDSDAIVKPNFITELKRLHAERTDHIVSGFNSLNKDKKGNLRNPIISEVLPDHYLKKYANGINMCFNKQQYEDVVLPSLLKEGNWDTNTSGKTPFVIARPSLVQHIGFESSMGHTDDPDVAADFYELTLPTVTLFGIDAHDPEGLRRAADICTRSVQFGDVQIITERLFSGREAYSKFCIADMAEYIKTDHVLIIHPDGYIQNPSAWADEFLEYDYGGASWWFKDGMNVGNGGFSLRSKKLLDILASLDMSQTGYHPEDEIICRRLRPWLEKECGIKFMPDHLANRFAIEAYNVPAPDNVYSGQFGFHGYHVSGLPIPPIQKFKASQPLRRNWR